METNSCLDKWKNTPTYPTDSSVAQLIVVKRHARATTLIVSWPHVLKCPVFSPDYVFPGWPSPFSTPSSSDMDPPSVTLVSEKDKDNAWLYTLDPILLTIIVMSSLGVLLGAVCAGLLLYCTCSYSGLSSRSSTTLENYNFELYDGIKHKVKINQQRCCSEAWGGATRPATPPCRSNFVLGLDKENMKTKHYFNPQCPPTLYPALMSKGVTFSPEFP